MDGSQFSSNVFFNSTFLETKIVSLQSRKPKAIHVSSNLDPASRCMAGTTPKRSLYYIEKNIVLILFSFSATVSPTCGASDFTCDNGNCIDAVLKCDQENDCGDNSDEQNCPKRKCIWHLNTTLCF